MKIRAITLFADLGPPLDATQIEKLGEFARAARLAYESDGFAVQTTRLATHVFPRLNVSDWADRPVAYAVALEEVCQRHGFDYISLGPAEREAWAVLPDLIAATKTVFVTVNTTYRASGTIRGDAIQAAAHVIQRVMTAEPGGFANLRFAALANVEPGIPFFPSAFYGGGPPSFAIATEAADLAVDVCRDARDAEVARWRLVAAIEKQGKQLERRARILAQEHDRN
jgi:uncharacterized protein (UPF0210 family)